MSDPLRVIACSGDNGGCGWYRIVQPVRAVQRHAPRQVTIDLREAGDERARLDIVCVDGPNGPVVVDAAPLDCDVLVLQRPVDMVLAQAIPFLQSAGTAVVVEVDDDFTSINPRNIAWKHMQARRREGDAIRYACQHADLVTVTTPRLAEVYGGHGRVRVLPNCLPPGWDDADPTKYRPDWAGPLIGWTGTVATHPEDLQETRGAVGRIAAEQGAAMFVVGTGQYVRERLALPASVPLFSTRERNVQVVTTSAPITGAAGWLTLDDYPNGVAAMDYGIVPLHEERFNLAKSDLKGLEMAAVGVPFVASPTPAYAALAASGVGLVAEKPKAWAALLRRLMTDGPFREDLVARGREVAAERTYDFQWWRWAEAWEDAVAWHHARQKGRAPIHGTTDLDKAYENRLARKAAGLEVDRG